MSLFFSSSSRAAVFLSIATNPGEQQRPDAEPDTEPDAALQVSTGWLSTAVVGGEQTLCQVHFTLVLSKRLFVSTSLNAPVW